MCPNFCVVVNDTPSLSARVCEQWSAFASPPALLLGDFRSPNPAEPRPAVWSGYVTARTVFYGWFTDRDWLVWHPRFVEEGWVYHQLHVLPDETHAEGKWSRGVGVVYTRPPGMVPVFDGENQSQTVQRWLRDEWSRSGLPFSHANRATGVKNAASRKWLTASEAWYPPPWSAVNGLAAYANSHGKPTPDPYFAVYEGTMMDTEQAWHALLERQTARGGLYRREKHRWVSWETPTPATADDLFDQAVTRSSSPGDAVWLVSPNPPPNMYVPAVSGKRETCLVVSSGEHETVRHACTEAMLHPILF